MTLLATWKRREEGGAGCTRKDILNLTLVEYNAFAEQVTEGFEQAAKLLYTQKIFTALDLPYQSQLTALTAILRYWIKTVSAIQYVIS